MRRQGHPEEEALPPELVHLPREGAHVAAMVPEARLVGVGVGRGLAGEVDHVPGENRQQTRGRWFY